MAKVTVVTSNQKMVHLNSIYRADEIDSTVESIREQLHELLDKDVAQDDYNKRYKLTPDDIVQDFNGDMLYLAMCLRDVYNDDLAPYNEQLQDDIQAIGDGLVKPHAKLVKEFSRILHFPEAFFTREGTVDREGKDTFVCSVPRWAG